MEGLNHALVPSGTWLFDREVGAQQTVAKWVLRTISIEEKSRQEGLEREEGR